MPDCNWKNFLSAFPEDIIEDTQDLGLSFNDDDESIEIDDIPINDIEKEEDEEDIIDIDEI